MSKSSDRRLLWFFLLIAGIGLYLRWKNFWFLTDDAFIAFRYVSNSVLGHGYTWNPEPFRAVEGYTSFLWVIMLEFVWRVLGVLPPQSANVLSLGFTFLTMVIACIAAMRLNLNHRLEKYRPIFIGLLLAGLLLSRTFLTWSSSGLETALFNCCFLAWIVIAVFSKEREHLWRVGITSTAALVYLARPDGLLIIMATLVLMAFSFLREKRLGRVNALWVGTILPLAIPLLHILWRRSYYGEWLPNTYYAKHIGAWPSAGIRYFASFVIEHGLWVWLLVLATVIITGARKYQKGRCNGDAGIARQLKTRFDDSLNLSGNWLCVVVVTSTVLAHIGYYTLIIGGDHFEWRVYSYLIPLVFLTFFYRISSLNMNPGKSLGLIGTLILFAWPIPWAHHQATKDITAYDIGDTIKEPVSDELPSFLFWLTGPQDALQDWLLDHHVCVRRMEHKLFWEDQVRRYPERSLNVPEYAGKYPTAYFTTVGVPGWVLPNVSIIDGYGLNDYVIARHAPFPREERLMAHDRYPPEGYYQSFVPNVWVDDAGNMRYDRRPDMIELTAEKIIKLEKYWEEKIVNGNDQADPTGVIY